MKVIHQFFWLLFAVSFVVLLAQYIYVSSHATGYWIFQLGLASSAKGSALLKQWHETTVDTTNMLYYARLNTLIDFLFLIGYTGVLIITSNYLMMREKSNTINELLRVCFPTAILVAILDIAEDFILLFDMYHYQVGNRFYSSAWVSYPKWALASVIVLIWIISFLNGLFARRIAI